MVWGYVGCNWVEIHVNVERWMDAELYVFILEDNLLSSCYAGCVIKVLSSSAHSSVVQGHIEVQ